MAGPDAFNTWFNIITDSTAELLESTNALLMSRPHSPPEREGLLALRGHIWRARAHFAAQSAAYLQRWLDGPPQRQQPTRAVWVRRGVNRSTNPRWIAARLQQLMTWSDESFARIYDARPSST